MAPIPGWGGIQPGAAAVDRAQHGAIVIDGDAPTIIFILEIDPGQRRGGGRRQVRWGGSIGGGWNERAGDGRYRAGAGRSGG